MYMHTGLRQQDEDEDEQIIKVNGEERQLGLSLSSLVWAFPKTETAIKTGEERGLRFRVRFWLTFWKSWPQRTT